MAARKMRADFASLSVVPHRALKGQEAEGIVREFLEGHLPKRFGVGSGFIIDPKETISRQTDIVIYDALNCPIFRASQDAAIFPSDNVAALVEVKASLDKQRLEEAFDNIASTKSLTKAAWPDTPFLVTKQTLGCLFAFESSLTLEKISEHLGTLMRQKGLGHHIDLIIVLDRGVISLACKAKGYDWAPMWMEGFGGEDAEGAHIAVGSQALGEDSLDGFLRLLLPHLINFRQMTGHPGFEWTKMASKGQVHIQYLTSITLEKDPAKKQQKLKEYAQEVAAEFAAHATSESGQPTSTGGHTENPAK